MRTGSTALAKTGSSASDTVFGSVDNHWVVHPEMKPAIKNNKPRQNEILGNAISWKERSDKPNGVSHLPVSSPDSHTPVKPRSPWFSWSSISKKPWLWAWVLFIFCSFFSSASSRTGKSFWDLHQWAYRQGSWGGFWGSCQNQHNHLNRLCLHNLFFSRP